MLVVYPDAAILGGEHATHFPHLGVTLPTPLAQSGMTKKQWEASGLPVVIRNEPTTSQEESDVVSDGR